MPGTRASSAQVTAKVQAVVSGTAVSEHETALALLESRRKAIEEARPFTERQAAQALLDLREQAMREAQEERDNENDSSDVEYLFSRPLTAPSQTQDSTPILVVDSSDSENEIEDADVTMTTQIEDADIDMTTEHDDVDAASSTSELTEIIVSGPTPPTSPVTQGGQSIQPARPSEQRQRLALLARGEEPLAERMERARQQHEQEIAEYWEREYAMSDPIEEGPESDDDSNYSLYSERQAEWAGR